MKKIFLTACILLCMTMLFGCSTGGETSAQSRTDLTAEHFRGLTADMKRDDVEALVGANDSSLADKEDIAVYSLSDGTTAVLHYVDDALAGAYIRGKDMFQDTIFNKFSRDEAGDTGNGNYDTENGEVNGQSDSTDGTDGMDDALDGTLDSDPAGDNLDDGIGTNQNASDSESQSESGR